MVRKRIDDYNANGARGLVFGPDARYDAPCARRAIRIRGENAMHSSKLGQAARAIALALIIAAPAAAQIGENQVLVVHNSAAPESAPLLASYLAAHPAIPAANVVDLNSATLLTANITYANFITLIRNPIRDHLSAAGAPEPADIVAIALLRPLPHRIQDTDAANAGDVPASSVTEFNNGDCNNASVDAELVLLWQNLEIGEAGGSMDSKSDNLIDNPYHGIALPISTFSRTSITTQKLFTNTQSVVWTLTGAGGQRLRAGDMYLVCRIDGNTLADAQAMIERAQDIHVPKAGVRIIFDEYNLAAAADLDDDPLFTSGDPFLAGDDYEETRNVLLPQGWDVRYDGTFDFISGLEELTPLIAYASYGENHKLNGAGEDPAGTGTYINDFTFAKGAIFNTVESYNGRALNGLATQFGQEQAADFIAAGGTFAIGHVWEPFTFSLPDNEFLFVNMLVNRKSFAEAAYSSIPALSWHHVVLGDPLARYNRYGDCDGDEDVDIQDFTEFQRCSAQDEFDPACACADLNGDSAVNILDYEEWEPLLSGPS